MIPVLNNILELESILIDTEDVQIALSEASKRMNEPQYSKRNQHTVGEIEFGKFRRLFDRHRTVYRLFN